MYATRLCKHWHIDEVHMDFFFLHISAWASACCHPHTLQSAGGLLVGLVGWEALTVSGCSEIEALVAWPSCSQHCRRPAHASDCGSGSDSSLKVTAMSSHRHDLSTVADTAVTLFKQASIQALQCNAKSRISSPVLPGWTSMQHWQVLPVSTPRHTLAASRVKIKIKIELQQGCKRGAALCQPASVGSATAHA